MPVVGVFTNHNWTPPLFHFAYQLKTTNIVFQFWEEMKLQIFTTILILFSCGYHNSQAQSVSPVVINSAGLSYTDSNYLFEINIGETIINTRNVGGYKFSQGFLQPNYLNILSVIEPVVTSNIKVYPNPAISEVYIQSDDKITVVVIYDMHGKQVARILNSNNIIPMDNLTAAPYMFVFYTEDNTNYHHTIIIKQ